MQDSSTTPLGIDSDDDNSAMAPTICWSSSAVKLSPYTHGSKNTTQIVAFLFSFSFRSTEMGFFFFFFFKSEKKKPGERDDRKVSGQLTTNS